MGLDQFLKPAIKILYNGMDKTHLMDWISIGIDDNEGSEADKLNITMGYASAKPRVKDTIEIYIDGFFMGFFHICTIRTNYKKSYEIEAISADFMSSAKERKSRTHKGSYKSALENIARENGLNAKINFTRSDEAVELEQHNQSDLAFCESIAKRLDLTFSVKNKTMIFIDKDKVADRVEYSLNESEYIDLSFEISEVVNYASCEVSWQDTKTGEWYVARAGEGAPILKFQSFSADSENEALKIAKARLQENQNGTFKGNLKCMGVPFFAGGYLNLQIEGETKRVIIKRISHRIDKAWISDIEFF